MDIDMWRTQLKRERAEKEEFFRGHPQSPIPPEDRAGFLDGASGLGRDTGGSPMELLLVGLAGCTAMDVAYILRKQRVEVSSLKVVVNARRAAKHPKVYEHIDVEYTVAGPDILRRHLEKAVTLSATQFCSASVMLGKTANIVHHLRLESDEGTWEGTLDIGDPGTG